MARTFRLQDPEVLRSGQELRDQSWRAILEGRLNYAPKFLHDKNLSKSADHDPSDGLIRTTMGYYRLAVDTRTEKKEGSDPVYVLLHSYERDQLATISENGITKFKNMPDDHDVYGRTARRASGPRFLEDIVHDRSYLEKCFQRDMNLHTSEKFDQHHVVKFANGRAGYGIFETDAGKYRVRYFSNLRHEWDEASRFANVDEGLPHGVVSKFLSMGRDVRDFDTYDEAFAHTREAWRTTAHSLFHGVDIEEDGLKNQAVSFALKSLDRRSYRFWASLAGVSAVVIGINNLLVGGSLRAAGWLAAVVAGMKIGGNILSSDLARRWMAKRIDQDRIVNDSVKPFSEVDMIDSYLAKDKDNKKRFLPRIDPGVFQYLRPLTHEEAKIKYSDSKLTDIDAPARVFESLSSAPYRYYGAMFDASHSREHGLLAAVFPNGLVSLTHIHRETQEVRRYTTYCDKFNLVSGDAKHLGPHSLPSKEPIHKITHRTGDDFRYVGMNGEAFIADLSDKAGTGTQHLRLFGLPLLDLFNIRDPGPVQARDMPTVPITLLRYTEQTTPAPH